jgi:hypothetical protein
MTENTPGHSVFSLFKEKKDNFFQGKYFQSAVERMGGKSVDKIIESERVPKEYFAEDRQIELYLKFFEQLSNWVNENLLDDPAAASLNKATEGNSHHGYDHIRRLEKWYKAALANDKELRSNADFLFFSPAAFMSMRFHDSVEVVNNIKNGHNKAGALFALGYLLQSRHLADEEVSIVTDKKQDTFPENEWIKMAWATAFMCLHHSTPEQLPSIDDVSKNGLFDLKELLLSIENIARGFDMSLEEYFPPYALIQETLQRVREGEFQAPVFTKGEIDGLFQQTRLFSACDKLDSNLPPDLSAIRTLQTSADRRPFFVRLEGNQSLEDELKTRFDGCVDQEGPCDFDRLLYEITRTESFKGVSPILSIWYADALQKKAMFVDRATSAFLEGDNAEFLSAYEHLEMDMTEAILQKAEVSESEAEACLSEKDDNERHISVATLLSEKMGRSADSYWAMLDRIRREREAFTRILSNKTNSMRRLGITKKDEVRMKKLIALARRQQERGLSWIPASRGGVDIPPYSGYYYIKLRKVTRL